MKPSLSSSSKNGRREARLEAVALVWTNSAGDLDLAGWQWRWTDMDGFRLCIEEARTAGEPMGCTWEVRGREESRCLVVPDGT